MAKAKYTFDVDEQLMQKFDAATASMHADGAELLRQFMHAYATEIPSAEGYDAWFLRQVEQGLADIDAGRLVPDDEVEAEFAQRRAETASK